LSARRDEDIRGLDVAVDDLARMRRVQRVCHLNRDVDEHVHRHRFSVDQVAERLAFEQLHGDELRALELVDLVDGADVRVVQRRRRARFTQKPTDRLLVADPVRGQELERDRARELGVFRFVHDAHAAGTERFEHTIMGDDFADHRDGFN
jgi:hypothetical protein